MKATTLFAFALCLGTITTLGAGAPSSHRQGNPREAGASSVDFYEVTATDNHGPGKLMIDIDQHKFVFNGKDFEPSKIYALSYTRAPSTDLRVFASAVAKASGNLHAEGTWPEAALPTGSGVVISTGPLYPGTIQRISTLTQPCYTLTYSDPYQTYTVYLPPAEITYEAGGRPLPGVISSPAALDYVTIDSAVTYTLSFRYQGTYYTAHYYGTCPQETPDYIYELKYYSTYSPQNGLWVGGNFTALNPATGEVIHVAGTAYVYYFYDPTPRLAGTVHTEFSPGNYYDFQEIFWVLTPTSVQITFHPDDPTVPQVTADPSPIGQ